MNVGAVIMLAASYVAVIAITALETTWLVVNHYDRKGK